MSRTDHTHRLAAFGATVRAKRLTLGISQETLAHQCNLDRTYIGGIERGERNVSLINITIIAEALGVKPSELLRASEMEASNGCNS